MSQILPSLAKSVTKLCILCGIKYQELSKELKKSYVLQASRELDSLSEKVNSSRLSVITGLQRKEIEALLSLDNEIDTQASKLSLVSKVIGQWQYHPDYSNSPGKPRTLSLMGQDSEFTELIKSVSTDLHTGTILFELERLKVVEKVGSNIKLKSKVNLLNSPDESCAQLVDDINTITNSVIQNIKVKAEEDNETITNLHATTEFNKILREDEDEIRAWILKEGSTFHRRVRDYLASKDLDTNKSKSKNNEFITVTVGAFSFIRSNKEEQFKKKN